MSSNLPQEKIGRARGRTLALTAVAMLVSAVLFNGGIASLLRERPELDNSTYHSFDVQWRRLALLDEPVETLILGDSSGRHGLDPEIIDAELATRSLGFCTMGDAAIINSAWQLEDYLARFEAPRRVILVAVHDVWMRTMKLPLLPRVPLRWGYWDSLPTTWPLSPDELGEIFLARYVPVVSQDRTVSDLLVYPWRARNRQLHFSDKGFSPLRSADPENAIKDREAHFKWTIPRGWSISEQSRRAVTDMIALAEEHGFDLYMVNSPQLEGMVDHPEFGPYYATGQDTLASIAAVSPRAHLVLRHPAEYPPELMQNSDHVAQAATADFSRRVAAEIASLER